MGVLLQNFPNITTKSEMNYDEFIFILSEKANLNKIYKAKIEGKGIEYFEKEEEKSIMELNSVKGLYNLV